MSLDHIGEVLLNDLPSSRTEMFFEFAGGFIYSSLPHFYIQFQALSGSKVNQTTPWFRNLDLPWLPM